MAFSRGPSFSVQKTDSLVSLKASCASAGTFQGVYISALRAGPARWLCRPRTSVVLFVRRGGFEEAVRAGHLLYPVTILRAGREQALGRTCFPGPRAVTAVHSVSIL